jgi:hypothetical protein
METLKVSKTFGVLVFYAVVLTVSLLLLLGKMSSRSRVEALSEARDVTALGGQLRTLGERTRTAAPGAVGPVSVAWSFGRGCTNFRGLVTFPHAAGGESQVWLTAQAEPARKLRRPDRRPLPGLTLSREDWRSDLVPQDHPGRVWIAVLLDAEADPAEDPSRQVLVNNFEGRGSLPAAAGVNRGVADLAEALPCTVTTRDRETAELLLAVLRFSLCDVEDRERCHPTTLTLYPDLKPDRFRLDGFSPKVDCGTLALRLRVDRDPEGRAVKAEFGVIQGATDLRCVALLDAVAPSPPGVTTPPTRLFGRLPDGGNQKGEIDLAELLEATAW